MKINAVVSVTHDEARDPVDADRTVRTLEELYEACRDAPPSDLVRVTLRGPDGEVRLQFGGFFRQG